MRVRYGVLLAFLSGACYLPLSAATIFTFDFDENGVGMISINGGAYQAFDGSLITDPSSTLGTVLAWDLDTFSLGPVLNGDVEVSESGGGLSDAIRFTDSSGNLTGTTANLMIFYSTAGGGSLADVGLPSNLGSGSSTSVVENQGIFTYVAGGGTRTYVGYSDVDLPEPGAAFLAGIGLAATFLLRRARRT